MRPSLQALDRPLTRNEMAIPRSYQTTRATITATSFVNHDEWGNFKMPMLRSREARHRATRSLARAPWKP
ncbi:MAG: hypothetical protein H6Q90_6338 [Deltaproteobacteria bacterium]|nr:hypothetical protein [Deltaproteobacteria bacterium]